MDNKNVEQWKPVVGYEGLYEVSNLGRVKSVERIVKSKNRYGECKIRVKEKILKAGITTDGYCTVSLWKNGVKKTHSVHRLVAETFIPNPCPEKYNVVNHKIEGDEGKLINTVENLEWCDIPYNNTYGTAQERRTKSLTNRPDCSKTVYQYTKSYELVGEYPSTQEAERQTGFKQSNISACCNGKKKTAYNYKWSYTLL